MDCSLWHTIRKIVVVGLLLMQVDGFAQSGVDINQFVQLNTVLSDGDNAPFWLTANRQGLSSLNTSSGYVRYGMRVDGTWWKNLGDE